MAESTIVVANLVTSERYFKCFEIECWDSTSTNKIAGPYTADGKYDPAAGKWSQKTPVYFRGLVLGTTYTFHVRVVPVRGQPSAWTPFTTEVAGDMTPPSVTYAAVVTAVGAGATVALHPTTSATDVDRYEVYQSLTNSTPATGVTIPIGQKSRDGNLNLQGLANAAHYLWARAVDTSGNQQAWVSIAGYTPTGVVAGSDLSVLGGRTADKLTYTSGGTVDSLKPAQPGADVTGSNTAANTTMVGTQAASTIAQVIQNGAELYLQGGSRLFTLRVW